MKLDFNDYFITFVIMFSVLFLLISFTQNVLCKKTVKPVVHTDCTKEKCRNESFKESEFCYWHHPLRQIFYPLGSEMTPRRSQRIAAQQGYMYTYLTD
jgi:hypothetical protein